MAEIDREASKIAQTTPTVGEKSKVAGAYPAFLDNISLSPYRMIKLINPILRGWGNYFGIGHFPRTFSLLDHWIWHRSWRYLRRKFPETPRPILVSRFYQRVTSPRGRLWHFHATWTGPSADAKPRCADVIWITPPASMVEGVPAHMF